MRHKVLIILVLLMSMFAENTWAYSDYNYQNSVLKSISCLENIGAIEKPLENYSESDFIKRREMFKLFYFINKGDHNYMKYYSGEETADLYKIGEIFTDILDDSSLDAYLAYIMKDYGILHGKVKDGRLIADFDSYVTYDEVFTGLYKLFDKIQSSHSILHTNTLNIDAEHPYFEFAENIGLINSTNPLDFSTPQVEVSQLDDYITAYEFMHLVYRALYIPTTIETDYLYSANYHLIEQFSSIIKPDDNVEIVDNTNVNEENKNIKVWEEKLSINKETAQKIADLVFEQYISEYFVKNTVLSIDESERLYIIRRFYNSKDEFNCTVYIQKSNGCIVRIVFDEKDKGTVLLS